MTGWAPPNPAGQREEYNYSIFWFVNAKSVNSLKYFVVSRSHLTHRFQLFLDVLVKISLFAEPQRIFPVFNEDCRSSRSGQTPEVGFEPLRSEAAPTVQIHTSSYLPTRKVGGPTEP